MSFKSNRSKATNFSKSVKMQMMYRDNNRCIFCSNLNITPAHYIPRSQGGLGILENGVCLCVQCHQALDNSPAKEHLKLKVERYLNRKHPDFKNANRIYRKGQAYE